MTKKTEVPQGERVSEVVDNYSILASITLLASFSILLNNVASDKQTILICILISVLAFILSLLLCLWHKIRFNFRLSLFDSQRDKIIGEYSKEIANVINSATFPKDTPSTPMKDQSSYKVIYSFCKNLGGDLKEASENCFRKPLSEKLTIPKFIIDLMAQKFRYTLFGIGLFFYLLSILAKLVSQGLLKCVL